MNEQAVYHIYKSEKYTLSISQCFLLLPYPLHLVIYIQIKSDLEL